MASTKLKRILKWGLFYLGCAGIGAGTGYTISSSYSYHTNSTTKEVRKLENLSKIDGMVKFAESAWEAFRTVELIVEFRSDHDMEEFGGDRWLSLYELLTYKSGDCDDGAIAFAALLSDNPQYDVKILWLDPKDPSGFGHMIAAYEYEGKWGYASFNHEGWKKNYSVFQREEYDSLDELIKDFNYGYYGEYAIVEITDFEMKFGRALQKGNKTDLEWKKIEYEKDSKF